MGYKVLVSNSSLQFAVSHFITYGGNASCYIGITTNCYWSLKANSPRMASVRLCGFEKDRLRHPRDA